MDGVEWAKTTDGHTDGLNSPQSVRCIAIEVWIWYPERRRRSRTWKLPTYPPDLRDLPDLAAGPPYKQ